MIGLFALLTALNAPPTDLVAVGAVVSPQADRSVAILRSGGRTRVASLGESAFGGRVVAVSPRAVTLEYGAQRLELRLPAAGAARAERSPASAAPEDPATPARQMQRRAVERRLSEEIPRILAETTIVPVTEAGRVTGVALTRIPEGTLLTDAGLRPGDILTEINGVPVDGLPTLIGLWPRLQNESVLQAVVLRNGSPVSLSVTLR